MSDTTDPTSIDAVAASIINAPVQEPEQDEIQDAEIVEETEAEEAEVAQAEDDESEAVEYDDQEGEEVLEQPAPQLYTVKVDGKTKQVTLDELTRGYSGQAYIQQNLESLAAAKKQMQQEYHELQQERQFLAEFRQKAEQGIGLVPPTPPSKDLFAKDPIGYMEQKIAYDEKVAEYQQQQQQLQVYQQRQVEQQRQQHQAYLQQQMQVLQERIPEFADPQKAPAYRDKMVQAGVNFYGFAPEELMSEADARRIAVLNDAMKWRQMQEAEGTLRQKAENARPVVKPGTKRSEKTSQAKRRENAAARMKSTGSVDDVARFLLS